MFPLATLVGMFCVCVSDKREIIERDLEYVKFICPAGCSHILKIRSHVTGKWVSSSFSILALIISLFHYIVRPALICCFR